MFSNDGTVRCEEIFSENLPMANGGVNCKVAVLFCTQGDKEMPSGLVFVETTPHYYSSLLLTSFYSQPFNSVKNAVVHSDGSV